MTDLCLCTKRAVGFAAVASFSVALTGAALGNGSEVPDGSVSIGSLPFADTGDTCDNFDDFDAVCPYVGEGSPDVFYSFTPASDISIRVSICNSGYDTKLYVLNAAFADIACNDDGCGADGFKSEIGSVDLTGGNTYHIGVDGWGTECGIYDLIVEEAGPCAECPGGAGDEGEPCGDDTNGGCNTDPTNPPLTPLDCGDVICGNAWADGATRDTDWYVTDTSGGAGDTVFTICMSSAFSGITGLISDAGGAPSSSCTTAAQILPNVFTTACGPEGCVSTDPLPPGIQWWFAGPSVFEGFPCGSANDYVLSLECEGAGLPCPWDFNGDNSVGFSDLLKILSNWGPCPTP